MAREITVKQESKVTEEETRPGRTYVPNVEIRETVRSFKELVDGKWDHLPEQAFMYVGAIEEAVENAEKLQAKG